MVLLGLVAALAGCSDLTNRADATVVLEAADRAAVLRLRQELLDQAGSWGGVRVGESTAERQGDTALTFSLPGRNLDAALGSIGRLDAVVASTSIDVTPEQVDRSAAPATTATTRDTANPDRVWLRVAIGEQSTAAGPGAALRLVMTLFSVVGMVATGLWVTRILRRRHEEPPRRARARVLDITGDPPTQETPRVPRQPW